MKYRKIKNLPTKKAYFLFECSPSKDSFYEFVVDYDFVIPLDTLDIRGTHDHKGRNRPSNTKLVWLDKKNNLHLPLGRTKIGTENKNYPFDSFDPNDIGLPYRDGAHRDWDGQKIGKLETFYTKGNDHFRLYKKENRHEPNRTPKTGAKCPNGAVDGVAKK